MKSNQETQQIESPFGFATDWKTEYRCINCDAEITWQVKMASQGRCPMCGHKSKRAGTIVETNDKAYRMRRTAPRWKFWQSLERVYEHNK